MTTITKEEVKAFIEQIESDLSNGWEAQIFELKLARIALASLEAEKGADPVVFTDERNLHHIARGRETSLIWGKQNQEVGDIPLYRHAQPVPVVPEDISGIIERFQYQADHLSEWHHIDEHSCKVNRRDLVTALEFMNSCRAAMLQGAEPVSNHDELPYAQVKAVADLYALYWQSGEVVTYTPDPEKATIWLNNYSGTCVQEYVKLERLQEALAGNSPVTPDGWISCSERMPEDEQEVIVQNKLGYRYVSYFDEQSGLFFDMRGGNQINCIEHILVTHWMPLPAAPQEVNHG
ncbi:DUF551 domain-containing protein [Salmonella enterica]|uniref:DUF551 domain-containing protein n=1 Tax=Salmonella enterica TaxID=28901 RepID=UPI001279A368|nr:DUF551 domain-containing protein [Salmonella enterica]ECG4261659.1 DUF551 domain-containing protein [Salmonella enterica subsp. enterica serovar Livingstone]EFB6986032.1 DUF551 domain-containing protein [Salmonella enterica subsp. enterica serovar Infantis]EAM7209142.1 DUF551 domain-containing protein [Salmonella enterica]EAN3866085.1 DUF551 domain-containing protein [Salmonella enterica]EAQ6210975.1 DUF551 domain-containing protein [Salmonella enterica]